MTLDYQGPAYDFSMASRHHTNEFETKLVGPPEIAPMANNYVRRNSQISNLNKKSEFQERFEGRNSLMNKEGYLGIIQNTTTPINKINNNQIITHNQT
jgi:hypothetical protein